MVKPTLPIMPSPAITVSDVRALRQLADSGQLKSWQAGAIMDVVVNRREGALLMVDTGKGVVGLPVPAEAGFKPGTALQLQVLTLAPLQLQLRPAPPANTAQAALTGALSQLADGLQPSDLLRPSPATTPSPAAHTATPPAAHTDSIAQLAQQLKVLLPTAVTAEPNKLAPLPQQLSEWLARLPPSLAASEEPLPNRTNPAANSPPQLHIDWPKLAGSLLASWPTSQQASEPESLEHLLRQALFAEPATASAGTTNTPRPAAASDWLGTVLRLLMTQTAIAPATTAAATNAATTNATAMPSASTATSANPTTATAHSESADGASLLALAPPLADDLVDQLATLLGRSQQHWLGNLQAEVRQQPLFAELLLRQGERLDPFELSVREDSNRHDGENEPARHHVVRLRFDLPGLGVCQFLLDLQADDLQLHFYSEQADTVALFNTHLDTLAASLAADAIHLNAVQSHRVEHLPGLQQPTEPGFHVRA